VYVKRVVWYGRGYVIVKLERGRDLEPFHGSASLVGHPPSGAADGLGGPRVPG
jgi:hypothetical protein